MNDMTDHHLEPGDDGPFNAGSMDGTGTRRFRR